MCLWCLHSYISASAQQVGCWKHTHGQPNTGKTKFELAINYATETLKKQFPVGYKCVQKVWYACALYLHDVCLWNTECVQCNMAYQHNVEVSLTIVHCLDIFVPWTQTVRNQIYIHTLRCLGTGCCRWWYVHYETQWCCYTVQLRENSTKTIIALSSWINMLIHKFKICRTFKDRLTYTIHTAQEYSYNSKLKTTVIAWGNHTIQEVVLY